MDVLASNNTKHNLAEARAEHSENKISIWFEMGLDIHTSYEQKVEKHTDFPQVLFGHANNPSAAVICRFTA